MSLQPYTTCTRCSGAAQPGTRNLMGYLLAQYPYAASWGIYNCRPVRGGTTLSQHACGRAGDTAIPTRSDGSADHALGDPVVRFLIEHSTPLGISEIIYARVRYSRSYPRGRYYGGTHPHNNHIHWSQTPTAAATLTYADIVEAAGPPEGEDVKEVYARLQAIAIRAGQDLGNYTPYLPADDPDSLPGADGEWGPKSRAGWDAIAAGGSGPDLTDYSKVGHGHSVTGEAK